MIDPVLGAVNIRRVSDPMDWSQTTKCTTKHMNTGITDDIY